jgi:hypothetical protein
MVEEVVGLLGLSSSGRNAREKLDTAAICVGTRPEDFSSSVGGSPSLHTVFEKHLVRKLRGLGVTVLGVDEYFTPQLCPCCLGALVQKHMQIKF